MENKYDEAVFKELILAGWAETLMTGVNAGIPYSTVFVSNEPPNENELKEGLALAEKYGWSFK